ncbi:hypothetical protein ZIOFF_038599 [Zingiber officinale]|uniref:Uncharacterized protein n=1 Tax=Zingiber officinale TaxID=94328 RepID=A0A8J5KWH8_ZINOF|nr:hypothetical protein ZIOFF_038599 [Zingiber officinale]
MGSRLARSPSYGQPSRPAPKIWEVVSPGALDLGRRLARAPIVVLGGREIACHRLARPQGQWLAVARGRPSSARSSRRKRREFRARKGIRAVVYLCVTNHVIDSDSVVGRRPRSTPQIEHEVNYKVPLIVTIVVIISVLLLVVAWIYFRRRRRSRDASPAHASLIPFPSSFKALLHQCAAVLCLLHRSRRLQQCFVFCVLLLHQCGLTPGIPYSRLSRRPRSGQSSRPAP